MYHWHALHEICIHVSSTRVCLFIAVSVSAVYGTLVKDFSPLLEVNTTAGVRPEVCPTSDNSSNMGEWPGSRTHAQSPFESQKLQQ